MTTLSPEQIACAVEMYRDGNKPRAMLPTEYMQLYGIIYMGASDGHRVEVRLNRAGLTIAKMAIALEQACATAETEYAAGASVTMSSADFELANMTTMRANKKELLG